MKYQEMIVMKSRQKLHSYAVNVEVITPQECLQVHSVVHDLREFWINRHPFLPFYSLGTASYFHAPSEQADTNYSTAIKHYNPLLRKHFDWLYKRLADTLAEKLAAPTHYPDNRLALPGFHIFLAHKAFEQPMAAIHRDLQYRQHKWEPIEAANFSHPISFTLAIALPQSGAGMNVWDLHHEEVEQLEPSEIEQLTESKKQHFHAYELGKIALHSGHFVHQIAPVQNIQPEDERITLQGHGIFFQGVLHLYW